MQYHDSRQGLTKLPDHTDHRSGNCWWPIAARHWEHPGLKGRLSARRPVDLAGDEARFVRGEENEQRGDLHRLRGALEVGVPAELAHLLGWQRRWDERRPHGPGRDGVDADGPFIASLERALVKLMMAALVGAYASSCGLGLYA